MSVSWAAVAAAFPLDSKISAVDGDTVGATYISWAEQRTSSGVLGHVYDQTVIFLAAHFASVFGSGDGSSPAGPVVAESVDGVSRSYAAPVSTPASASDLSSTSYGRQALSLMENSLDGRLPSMVVL